MPRGKAYRYCLLLLFIVFISSVSFNSPGAQWNATAGADPYIVVLGIAQDGGYPQAGCKKACCKRAWDSTSLKRSVSCLALVDPVSKEQWIFDATPDFKEQLHQLQKTAISEFKTEITGIFLTHGHIGHYVGLMDLGREVMGAKNIPVYAMPRMKEFLSKNGPWSQLVSLNNIVLMPIANDSTIKLNSRISITPFLVPHRDEFTETVGYKITGPGKSVIFIPDIDKWEKWKTNILELVKKTDILFLDGTFFQNGELPGVDMTQIPHPFISESMELFKSLSPADKAKINFIHFNHTNPVLVEEGEPYKQVIDAGFKIAKEMQVIKL